MTRDMDEVSASPLMAQNMMVSGEATSGMEKGFTQPNWKTSGIMERWKGDVILKLLAIDRFF